MNIMIIEDDVFLSKKIKSIFEKKEEVNIIKLISSYDDFINNYFLINSFDIILVDIHLSKNKNIDSGIEIIKLIRKKNKHIPIIIISGLNDIGWLRIGFDSGANDYICKPFRLAELEIRVFKWIKDFLKSETLGKDDFIEYNGLKYCFDSNKFYFKGNEIYLTKLNKIILLFFISRKEELLSDSIIIEKIWGDFGNISDRNIRVTISRLKKILDIYGLNSCIYNVRGEGYMFKIIN